MARQTRQPDKPAREPSQRQVALRQAAAAREKELSDLRARYEPKIAELVDEWAEKRREAWRAYEERKGLIRQAALLETA